MREPIVVIIKGGLTAEPEFADIGPIRLDRDPGEPIEAFRERATAAAKVWHARTVVIGGLSG